MLRWMGSLIALSDDKTDNICYINLRFKNSLIDYNILSKNFNNKQKVLNLLHFGNIIEFKEDFPFIIISADELKFDNCTKTNNIKDFIDKLINENYESVYLFKNNKWNFLSRDEFCNLEWEKTFEQFK
jgi:ribonuclease HIII